MEKDYKRLYEEALAERQRIEEERESLKRIHETEMSRIEKRQNAVKFFIERGYNENETAFLMAHFSNDKKLDGLDAETLETEVDRLHDLFQRTIVKYSANNKKKRGLFRKGAN